MHSVTGAPPEHVIGLRATTQRQENQLMCHRPALSLVYPQITSIRDREINPPLAKKPQPLYYTRCAIIRTSLNIIITHKESTTLLPTSLRIR